jgi:hypothetical protein
VRKVLLASSKAVWTWPLAVAVVVNRPKEHITGKRLPDLESGMIGLVKLFSASTHAPRPRRGAQMPNGKHGDNPLSDLTIHGQHPFPSDIDKDVA